MSVPFLVPKTGIKFLYIYKGIMRVLLSCYLMLSISCNNTVSQSETSGQKKSTAILIQRRSFDDSQYHFLKSDLFLDDSGNTAYRAYDQTVPRDIRNDFITTVHLDTGATKLRFVIDTTTFEHLGDLYYRDKKYVYYHFPMMDGGFFNIIKEADRKSIRVFGTSWYAKDKYHIYCRGDILENADYRTFTIIPLASGKDTSWLGKDRNHVYDVDRMLDEQTLKDWNVRLANAQ